MSQHSANLRERLSKISDFKEDFAIAFSGAIKTDLPKDEELIKKEANEET